MSPQLLTTPCLTHFYQQCDERFPICANCERSKRHCPGPKARFIRFIGPGNEEHVRGDTVHITALSRPPSCSRSESLAAKLASRLDGIKEIGYQLQALGNFFPYIVPRLGHNAALDAAVKCLLGAHQTFIAGNRTSSDQDVKSYNHAMSLIRTDLNQLQRRTPSETIYASMLLCRYEVRLRFWLFSQFLTLQGVETKLTGLVYACRWRGRVDRSLGPRTHHFRFRLRSVQGPLWINRKHAFRSVERTLT